MVRTTTLIITLLIPLLSRAGEAPVTTPPEVLAGSLILHGSGQPKSRILESFYYMSGRENARIVVIDDSEATTAESIAVWKKSGVYALRRISPADHDAANDSTISAALLDATGVWIAGSDPAMLADVLCGTALGQRVMDLFARGRVVGGRGAGAEILAQRWIKNGDDLGVGLGLFPNAVIHTSFIDSSEPTLAEALGQAPGIVGYGIPEDSALAMRGRIMQVIGDPVSILLAPSGTRPARKDVIGEAKSIDLIAMARAAIARAKPTFPVAKPPTPNVVNGSLVIVGGGLTDEILNKFIELAGGADDARIVVIPTAIGPHAARSPGRDRFLKRAGVKNIQVVHAANRNEAIQREVLDPLRNATGIWFTGGRQWRLVDSFLGTEAERLMHQVLERGGVIGGSSAGATIQADYLVRGNPLGNREMMAEGYEQGLGFIKGVAIDQHFSQRNRFADMSNVKRVFPQLIGLGIDENTAVVVQKSILTVVGKNKLAIYDRKDSTTPGPEYKTLSAGQSYDFGTRRIIEAEKQD